MSPYAWTPEREAELRRLYAKGSPIADMCCSFGTNRNVIYHKICLLGLSRERSDAWSDEQTKLAVERHAAGDSAAVIARLIGGGLSRNAVTGKLHRMGIVRKALPKRASAPKEKVRTYIEPRPIIPIRPTTPDDMGWSAHARPFMLTTKKQCRWPLGPASDLAHSMMPVCAGPVVEGRPYCPDHCERAGNGYTHTKRIKPPFESTVIRRAV